jgi:hypothetical protein
VRELCKVKPAAEGARSPVNLRSLPTTVASGKQRYKVMWTFFQKGVGPCVLEGSPLRQAAQGHRVQTPVKYLVLITPWVVPYKMNQF